ncbi:hypothetical protein [Streptomyces parvus]
MLRPHRISFASELLHLFAAGINACPKSVDLKRYRITDRSMSLLAAS